MTAVEDAYEAVKAWGSAAAPAGELLQGKSGSWEVARETYLSSLEKLFPAPDGVSFSEIDMGGIPGTIITPDNAEDGKILFYIHGGGYAIGGPRAYHGLAGHYAKLLRAKVYIPDYRLAPQHQFPAPIDDVFTAYRWLIEQDIDPRKLALSGDSAGGAMVVTIMRKARDAALAMPIAGVAISPWANLAHSGASITEREGLDPLNTLVFLNLLARNFLGNALPTNPDASPVFADVRDLPPVMVQVGENELMLSDAVRLAGHLAESRVRVSLEVWPKMFHVWHFCAGFLPEAQQALRNAVAFINAEIYSAHNNA